MVKRARVGSDTLYGIVVFINCGSRLSSVRIRNPMDLLAGSINSKMTGLRLKGQTSPLTVRTPPETDSSKGGLTTPTGSDGLPGGLTSLVPEESNKTWTEFNDCILPALSSVLTVRRPTSAVVRISNGTLICCKTPFPEICTRFKFLVNKRPSSP